MILATGLALAMAIGAYVALTWHPRAPLRFRMVELHGPQNFAVGAERTFGRVVVAVENVTPTPIYVLSMWDSDDAEKYSRTVRFEPATFNPVQTANFRETPWLIVPAHGVSYADCNFEVSTIPRAARGRIRMYHMWYSSTRYHTACACHWLYRHSPVALRRIIPYLPMHLDATDILPPAARPARAS
ncbi:hypothetical protein DES53_115120 [Roseimicrobium gellanilyticum]|uniref:Uncharacterized protein n=2 Tax=Roseimicrobium gellanilyticum TaxID=748857 RepID=A0A366H4Z3_9BACT|nr:hypothetical protein DES53_115120 [Roseimicrobium gellanilyticum]